MLPTKKRIALVLALAPLLACGKEVGRVPFAAPGANDATMTLKAGDVDFWTDIDLSWEGPATLDYQVTLEQGGKAVATATCNPFGQLHVKQMWAETNIGSSHSRRGRGKMSCSTSLPSSGPTTVKATLAWGAKPSTETLRRADLVVKQ